MAVGDLGSIAAIGTLDYNGFAFPNVVKVSTSSVSIPNNEGTNKKLVALTTQVEFWIVDDAGGATDEELEDIRNKLSEWGKRFQFDNQGFGTVDVGPGGTTFDGAGGPIPKVLTWNPIGSIRACHCIWSVTVHVPECSAAKAINQSSSSILGYGYTIGFSVQNLLVTRTISGYIEIPQFKTADNRFANNPDDRLGIILKSFPRLPGFNRAASRQITPDRKQLQFTITDQEYPSDNPYYPGMLQMDIDQDFSTGLSDGFAKWNNTISGSIMVAPGVSRVLAFHAFGDVIRQRTKWIKQAKVTDPKTKTSRPASVIIPTSISLGDSIFGLGLRFSVTFMMTCSLSEFIKASGIFRPLEGTSWEAHAASLETVGKSLTGRTNLRHQIGGDVIIDFCAGNTPGSNTPTVNKQPYTWEDSPFKCECPPTETSWIRFDNNLRVIVKNNIAYHSKLGSPSLNDEFITNEGGPGAVGGAVKTSGTPEDHIIQYRGKARPLIEMKGYALRAGHEIPEPFIKSIGGTTPALKDKVFDQKIWKQACDDCPIYLAKWRLLYVAPNIPSGNLLATIEAGGYEVGTNF